MTGERLDAASSPPGGATDRARGLALALAGVLVYVALHAGFRLLASSTLGEDDTLDQLLVQDLRFGYDPRQPPLYDWVLWAVQQVTGPRLVSFLLIKYAALAATVVFLYLAAYRILADRIWALLTVESLALIYQISWRYHEGFTHEVLAMVAVTATLWAFLRLFDRGSPADYLLFGLISGLGMLTEPNYTVYQACLWIAAALQPSIRRRVVRPMLWASAAIALLIAAPFMAWVASDGDRLAALWRPSPRGHLVDMAIGVKDALRGPFMYLAPLIVILPIVFPGFVRQALTGTKGLWPLLAPRDAPADLERLVATTMFAGIALSLAGGLLFGIGGYAMHVLMPLYVTSPIALFAVAKGSEQGARRRPVLARLALVIAAVALVARLANMFVLDPVCGKCRWGIPYDALAETLRNAGTSDTGTIVVLDAELGGNLRSHFPNARFELLGPRTFVPEKTADAEHGRTLVWDASMSTERVVGALTAAPELAGQVAQAHLVQAPWSHLWKPRGYRTSDWRYVRLASPRR